MPEQGPDPLEPRPHAGDDATATRALPRRAARLVAHGATHETPSLSEGRQFGAYLLRRRLGTGGFAEVWEAVHGESGRLVAVKVLTRLPEASAEAAARFQQEGRLAAALSHPRCVYVMSAETIEGCPVIVMEAMPGGTLQDLVDREGPLPHSRAVDLVLDVIEGLDAAARRGIVHRDVKPSNCFLDADGRARIGDFGISKGLEMDVRLTGTGVFIGTPAYASPEQIRGRAVDFRSDMYSVGATLFALLSGRPPFEATSAGDLLARITGERPADLPWHVPRRLRRIVMRLLDKEPAERFASYGALRRALRPLGARATEPARTRDRLAAFVGDAGLVVASFAATVPLLFDVSSMGGSPAIALLFVLEIAWLAVPLMLWGRTLGHRAKHLVVMGRSGPVAGWSGLRRGMTLLLPHQIALAAAVLTEGADKWLLAWYLYVWPLLVAAPASRRRGVTLLDVLSATRLVRLQPLSRETPPVEVPWPAGRPAEAAQAGGGSFGHFRVVETLWSTGDQEVLLALDEGLQRRAWVHVRQCEVAGPVGPRHALARPGRVRWLARGVDAGRPWDAFEVPTGMSLVDFVRVRGRLPWEEARQVLLGLLEELQAGLWAGDLPASLSIDHLWVDASGQLKILDVPVRAVAAGDEPVGEAWPRVVHQAVLACLEGALVSVTNLPGRLPRVPLPEHVRPFVRQACSDAPDLAWLIADLRESASRPPRVTKAMRSFPIVLRSLPSIGLMSIAALIRLAEFPGEEGAVLVVVLMGLVPLMVLAGPSILLASVARGGPLLRDAGIAVQTTDGQPASRLRCLWRAALAWSPTLAAVALVSTFLAGQLGGSQVTGFILGLTVGGFSEGMDKRLGEHFEDRARPADAAGAAAPATRDEASADRAALQPMGVAALFLLVAQAVGASHALLRPERSLADRAAGTILVPR